MEKKTMGAFLAALRKASGMTQKQLADRLNVSDKAVSRWERDENAPDLSLIPVIAEVFGVTSDELLRGERSTSGADPDRAAAKAEKQIRRILKDTLTKFKIRSAVSAAVALAGLIAAMIGNLGFLRAYIGFLVGCLFFVAAALCQVIFLILAHSAVDPEEVDPALAAPVRKAAAYGSELVFGFIFMLFAACLPLVMWTHDTYLGLSAGTWLQHGLFFGALSLLPVFGICAVVNLKLGYWTTARFQTPLGKLRLRFAAIALALTAALGALQLGLAWYLSENRQLLTDARVIHSWEEFKEYMETPLDTVGRPMTYRDGYSTEQGMYLVYETSDGGILNLRFDDILTAVYAHADDEENGIPPAVEYRRLNMYVSSMQFSTDGDLLPVRIFTHDSLRESNRKAELLLLAYSALYPAMLCAVYLRYRKKKS